MLSPPKRLAIAYARTPQRQALALLLCFDVTLAGIALRGSEAILAQLRMAWWRDVIGKDAAERPQGEPISAELSRLQSVHPHWHIDGLMRGLIDGWEELLADDNWSGPMIARHIDARAAAIFCGFGAITGQGDAAALAALGRHWALSDLRWHCGDADRLDAIMRFPAAPTPAGAKIPRALTMLDMAARDNISPLRLYWHGLTGRGRR